MFVKEISSQSNNCKNAKVKFYPQPVLHKSQLNYYTDG